MVGGGGNDNIIQGLEKHWIFLKVLRENLKNIPIRIGNYEKENRESELLETKHITAEI